MTMLNREDSVKKCCKSFLKHLSTLGESRLRVCEEDPSKLAAQHRTWCLANRGVFERSYTKHSWNLKKLLRELKATGKAREVSNSGGDNRRMFIVFETQVGRMNSRTNSNADDNDAPADINHSNFKLAGSKTFLERNKGGIVIDEPLTFEIAAFNTLNERNVKIQNKSDNVKYLSEVSILGETHSGSFEVLSNLNGLIRINKNSSIHVKIRFQPRAVGQCKALFVFRFNGFVIGRFINATCGDADIYAATAATAPYKRSRRREALKGSIVDGEPPRGGMGTPYVRGMKPNGIPKAIERMGKGEMREFLDIVANNLDEDFEKNYKPCFKHMLHAEEICLQENLSQFNLEHITMSRKGSLLELHVRGLEEKRPSILVRDDVYATGVFPGDSNKYKGYVHQVQQESVMLKFSKRFHERYSKEHRPHGIEFNFSRRTMKVLLQSVDLVHSSSAFIRPLHTPVHTDFPDDAPIGQWFNKSLNDVQRHVVRNILRRYPHAGTPETNIPYVIFGPPGTGKTVTLVESVKQLARSSKRILVCAPSNTAADLLVARLSDTFDPEKMFRIMSFQRPRGEVSEEVMRYCNFDEGSGGFTVPPIKQFTQYQIVVSTLMMSGKLYNHGIEKHFFNAVFVDEAGHALEPEICCTFPFLLKPTGLLVLAGDPKQLGPVTYSNSRLKLSMLERILEYEPYSRNPNNQPQYNPSCISKLVYSYRCHPDIMKIPNKLFYDEDLIDRTGGEARALCGWKYLPNPKFPLIFHGVNGENTRESTSPSWFNQAEIELVLHYVRNVVETEGVALDQIGVIAPYQKQAKKIRRVLEMRNLEGVMVGSCEQFQGQEKKVIIISTVRSSVGLLTVDSTHNLGFVANPKRLNVAVTRAKSLLIIIGSPAVLWTDANWRILLDHIRTNGGCTGALLPDDADSGNQSDMEAIEAALEEMNIDTDANGEA